MPVAVLQLTVPAFIVNLVHLETEHGQVEL
jgi:hypothetical protein